MRRFNRGYAIIFLLVLIAALLGVRYSYQYAAPYFSEKAESVSTYTMDDWISFFHLDETLGEPDVTPVPADQYPFTITPHPTPTATATPES